VREYNETRLHAGLGYLTPAEYYRGDPAERIAEREAKLAAARERRRAINQARLRKPRDHRKGVTSTNRSKGRNALKHYKDSPDDGDGRQSYAMYHGVTPRMRGHTRQHER
jgi:hypothetical protein